MKKFGLVLAFVLLFSSLPVQAAEVPMYVHDIYVTRELGRVGDFDMLPILDIAGEMGYACDYDGTTIRLWKGGQSFTFTMGSPDVYDQNGMWFGLDVVPQIINGKVMIPANFLIYNLGTDYTWDDKTSTLFINSDNTYRWLISTPEYQNGVTTENDTRNILEKIYDEHPGTRVMTLSSDKRSLMLENAKFDFVKSVNQKLGLPESLSMIMGATRPIDGQQVKEYEHLIVTWVYNADKGSRVIYELK